jgi:autotransporter-associated beta strand protein
VLDGGTISTRGGGGGNTNDANIALTANSFLDSNNQNVPPTYLNGVISGSFGLTKINGGSSSFVLTGVNTYSGDTTVTTGTLALGGDGSISQSPVIDVAAGATLNVTARTDGTLTLADGQTLQCNGTIAGILSADSGSIVSPGTSVGVLTVTGAANLLAGSDTAMEIDAAGNTNDLLTAASVAYGGTLTVEHEGTLALGQSYKLFHGASYSGAFDTLNLPLLDEGLSWSNSLAINGTLTVVETVVPPDIQIPTITTVERSGDDLVLIGTNGTLSGTFYVVVSSDIALPLESWTVIATNAFGEDGTFSVNITIDPEQPQQFFNLLQQVP